MVNNRGKYRINGEGQVTTKNSEIIKIGQKKWLIRFFFCLCKFIYKILQLNRPKSQNRRYCLKGV